MNFKFVSMITVLLLALATGPALCDGTAEWLAVKSGAITVEYQSSVDLKDVVTRLNSRGLFPPGVNPEDDAAILQVSRMPVVLDDVPFALEPAVELDVPGFGAEHDHPIANAENRPRRGRLPGAGAGEQRDMLPDTPLFLQGPVNVSPRAGRGDRDDFAAAANDLPVVETLASRRTDRR